MTAHSTFNHHQRKGILGLIVLIIILSGVIFWLKNKDFHNSQSSESSSEVEYVQHFIDSLKQVKQEQAHKIYPFNPNFITDYKGYQLGMSSEEINRLLKYRAQNRWVNSKEEFQTVTQISDSLLNVIAPYFKFPEWVNKQVETKASAKQELSEITQTDLNNATSEDLREIKGIGQVLAQRITRYRNQIGGFVDMIQLKDIYGLKYEVRQRIETHFFVENKQVDKLDINTASTADLTEIPYFNYELARRIVDYRITHEGIKTFEELSKIKNFPYGRMDRVKLFVKIE